MAATLAKTNVGGWSDVPLSTFHDEGYTLNASMLSEVICIFNDFWCTKLLQEN